MFIYIKCSATKLNIRKSNTLKNLIRNLKSEVNIQAKYECDEVEKPV